MLAARFVEAGKPFAVETIDVPAIDADEVLVAIKAAGICGTDVHYHTGEFAPYVIPLTLGHEGAGVVTEVGEKVTHLAVGDHVVIHYIISCGQCKPCLQGQDNQCRRRQSIGSHVDGTFAEYIKVPARSALKMADHVPFEWGAIAACAVSTPYHALTIAGLKAGDTALVFGVGGVGLHAVMWAKVLGAKTVLAVDLIDSKLEEAQRYGADIIVNAAREDVTEAVNRATDGWGVDVAIECAGSPTAMAQAIKAIKGKNRYATGTAVSVGLQTTPPPRRLLGPTRRTPHGLRRPHPLRAPPNHPTHGSRETRPLPIDHPPHPPPRRQHGRRTRRKRSGTRGARGHRHDPETIKGQAQTRIPYAAAQGRDAVEAKNEEQTADGPKLRTEKTK